MRLFIGEHYIILQLNFVVKSSKSYSRRSARRRVQPYSCRMRRSPNTFLLMSTEPVVTGGQGEVHLFDAYIWEL